MTIDGYMIQVDYDESAVTVTASNKASATALLGDDAKDGTRSVTLPRDGLEMRAFKPANALVNGHVILGSGGRVFMLHFRRKQGADFKALADALS